MSADCEGVTANRGDGGRPIIFECRLPRSECVTETFKPPLAIKSDALVPSAVGVLNGSTGEVTRIP